MRRSPGARRSPPYAESERDIPGVVVWVQQPCASNQTDVTKSDRRDRVACRVRIEPRLRAGYERYREADAEAIRYRIRSGDIDGMEVDDERLVRRHELCTDKQLVGVKMTVSDGDSPPVRCKIRHLQFALSPQTGGCETHWHSALGERLPREYHDCDAGRQKCYCTTAHRPPGFHNVSCSRSHCAFSCFMNATNSGSLRIRSRFGSRAKYG